MSAPVFPMAKFRALYPQFSAVSNETVTIMSEQALCFFSLKGCECTDLMWLLMTAHLVSIHNQTISGGAVSGQVLSATIDKVSVSFAQASGNDNAYRHFLNSTPFGQQLLALMSKCAGGMFYVGGRPELRAFKRAGDRFRGR